MSTSSSTGQKQLATIGYESATVSSFLSALKHAKVKLLVDVRALAMSRRPGFAKSALTANLRETGIGYLHLKRLGTPADGRAAARAGHHDVMQRIFAEHLATAPAQQELAALADLVRGETRICIMCFEAHPEHCHRRLIANALMESMPLSVHDLAAYDE